MCKVHVFIIISFFHRNLFLITILKGLKPFQLLGKTWNWIKELFFSDFSRVKTWYMTVLVPPEIPRSRIWHLNFAETKKRHQYFNWKSYQPWSIHHTINNWLGSIFFSPRFIQKECFLCFIYDLKVSLRLILIQMGGLCPLRLLPLMKVLCLCPFRVQHQRTAG